MTEVRSLDLTGAVAPALSTTSDMPVPGVKPTPVRGAISEEKLKAGGTGHVKAENVKEDANADRKSDHEATQERSRQREAESRAAVLEQRLDRALSAAEKLSTSTDTQIKTEPADPRPKRFDFDDPDTYDDALVAWSAKTAAKLTEAEIEKRQKEREAIETTQKQQANFNERVDAWNKTKTAAIEKYPDFVEVAESPDLSITPSMAMAILEENLDGGNGYEISYYLGKHPKEAAKIAAMPQGRQGSAIGRLAERIEAQRTKSTGSRARETNKSLVEESMDEYARRRNAEIRARS